jgi:3-dehydroquinate dehydratase
MLHLTRCAWDIIKATMKVISSIASRNLPTSYKGIIINPGAYTHTSVAIRDALTGIQIPVIEVHLSNIYAREHFRRVSMIKDVCVSSFVGFGLEGYKMAVERMMEFIRAGF